MSNLPEILPNPPRPIVLLAFPGVQLLDIAGPLQVFATANDFAAAEGCPLPYALHPVAPQAGPVATSSGLAMMAAALASVTAPVDTLIVAGGPGVYPLTAQPAMRAWLGAQAAGARRVASVCTGAFLLGACGLLDGRRVVTHWSRCADLAARFPAARVDPAPIFIHDRGLWTSAGITAGIDLALALVGADLGPATARAIARHLVMFPQRPGDQAQFATGLPDAGIDERFAALHDWIGRHLADDLPVATLAREAGMSARSFARLYRARCGLTPARAVERLRVAAAQQWLADTSAPLKRIARQCGFGSVETMRQSFLRHLASTPQAYRERFSAMT